MFFLIGVVAILWSIETVAVQNASFSGAQGVIYSPGYPDDYGNQLNQYYIITVDPGYFIHLTLYDFETEACCDKLYIWNGADTSAPTIANVSGDATGMMFSSSGNVMTLLFSTDITGQERGFAIHYEMVQTYAHIPICFSLVPSKLTLGAFILGVCQTSNGGRYLRPVTALNYAIARAAEDTQYSEPSTCQSGLFTSGLGFVTSPSWPSNYPNDITCNYLMTMPKGRVMLTFVAFSTEACCDKVEIYDGPNATYPKLAILSGNSVSNTTYYSTQQSLFLTFYSDYTQNDKGFSAYYKQV